MQHIFTVDVEDWYHGFAPSCAIPAPHQHRLEYGMNILLDALDETGTKATFFWLGDCAERYPTLLKDTLQRGHEIGCHGYDHAAIYALSPRTFDDQTRRSIESISHITGEAVRTYRAAYFSIRHDTTWALEILVANGITHDSSILPMRHWRTGMPETSDLIHEIITPSGSLIEVPVSVRKYGKLGIPTSGGGYFRAYPYSLTKNNITVREAKDIPAVFYIHPWELDTQQPQHHGHGFGRKLHYYHISKSQTKLQKLLADFQYAPMTIVAEKWLHTRIENNCTPSHNHSIYEAAILPLH